MKTWFLRMKQAVSGRLLSLKHKFGKPQLRRFTAQFHAWMHRAKDWLKESYLITKCALLIFVVKLRMKLSPEAMKGYWNWLKNLPRLFTRENMKKCATAFWVWLKTLPETFRGLRKSGVLASLTLFALLLFMGHSATVAWLTYTTPVARNSFQVGNMDLQVAYSHTPTSDYVEMTKDSELFNDEALYEPGYTQVVYLRVKNNGDVPFDYKFTVTTHNLTIGKNVYGDDLYLSDYLRFGMITAENPDELENQLPTRKAAQALATKNLGDDTIDSKFLDNDEYDYAALVVCMPEHIGNEANYRGVTVPQVQLGVTVYAQQAGTPMEP